MQQQLFDSLHKTVRAYCEPLDDKTIRLLAAAFVYHDVTDESKPILADFLDKHGVEKAYNNFVADFVKHETKFFRKSEDSEISVINAIKNSIGDVVFYRFSLLLSEMKPAKKLPNVETTTETLDGQKITHITGIANSEYTLCGVLIDGDHTGEFVSDGAKVSCSHCKRIHKKCSSTQL